MVDLNLERSMWELIHVLYSDRLEAEVTRDDLWDDDEPMISDLMVNQCVIGYGVINFTCSLCGKGSIEKVGLTT